MIRRILWLTLFAVIAVTGVRMVEYSETMKAELLRVAGVGLLAFALARWHTLRARLRTPVDIAVLTWLGVELLATLFSASPFLSLFGEQEQHEGLLTSLSLFGVYAATRLDARDASASRRMLDVLFVGAGVASLWAFLQASGVVAIAADRAQLAGVMRPFGTLGHPNLLGVVTAAAAAAAFARALTEDTRRATHLLAFGVFAAATAITFSRGAWLALAAGVTVAGLVALGSGAARRLPRGAWIGMGVAAIALVAIAIMSGWGGAFVSRLQELVSPSSGSSRSRLEIWRAALAAWRARPLLGWGPDTFGLMSERFATPGYWLSAWGEVTVHAHSVVLQTLATRGVLGLLAALAVLVTLVKSWREALATHVAHVAAMAGLLVAGLFGAWGIAGALVAVLIAAHAANAADPAEPIADGAADQPKPTRRVRAPQPAARAKFALTLPGIVGITAALVMAGFVSNELMGSRAIANSLLALRDASAAPAEQARAARSEAAVSAARAAKHLPWDDHGPRIMASALMQSANGWPDPGPLLNDAEQAARDAVRRVPWRAANDQCLADVLIQRARNGDPQNAAEWDSCYANAARHWPSNPYIWAGWARARSTMARADEARAPAAMLERLYPHSGLAALVNAEVALARGDTLSAREAMDRAANGEYYGDIATLTRAERLSRALATRH